MLHINDLWIPNGRVALYSTKPPLQSPKVRKSALVGRNGTGKSTLFNLIKGSLSPDDGSINLRKGARLGRR